MMTLQSVAVKIISKDGCSDSDKEAVTTEVAVAARVLPHPNIIQFFQGACSPSSAQETLARLYMRTRYGSMRVSGTQDVCAHLVTD